MRPLIPRYPIATPPLAITNHPRVTLPAYGVGFKRLEEKLEVANPPIRKNAAWIEDVAAIFSPPKPLPRSRPEKPLAAPAMMGNFQLVSIFKGLSRFFGR